MQNLGKSILILFLAAMPLLGALSASVDETAVTMGDTVTLSLRVSGENIEPPQVAKVCGVPVESTAHSTNIQAINGKVEREETFSYTFMPQKSCRIDPIAVKIDGKYESSEPIELNVTPMQVTKNAPFVLEMSSDRKQVYVGEPFTLTVTFKQRHNAEAVDSKFAPPEMKNFWIKEESAERRFEEGDYTVSRIHYVVSAQTGGTQTIAPAKIQIAQRVHNRDAWGMWMQRLKWRTFFSNELDVEVLTPPQGARLVGHFAIEAKVDKREVAANDAVNLTLRIKGSGNFEDIGSLKPTVPGVSIFEEEPKVKGYLEQGEYKGSWMQKFAFVAERDYTIPPIEITYFDPETKQMQTIRSAPIYINVKNDAPVRSEPVRVERAAPEAPEAEAVELPVSTGEFDVTAFVAGAAIGLLLGIAGMRMPWSRWTRRRTPRGDASRNERTALKRLMRHLDDEEASRMAEALEAKLYEGEEVSIDAKALRALLRRIEAQEKMS